MQMMQQREIRRDVSKVCERVKKCLIQSNGIA